MGIIFLDIDGVIILDDTPPCEGSIAVLNEVIRETGADIVVSSDRRRDIFVNGLDIDDEITEKIARLEIFLNSIGVEGKVVGTTPETEFTNSMFLERDRGREIDEYLATNNITDSYVVVDDIPVFNGMAPETRKDNRFIHTKFYLGLKEKGIKEQMIKILRNEHE